MCENRIGTPRKTLASKPKAIKIIVAKPPRRGVYVFNGMPTMTAPLWNKRVKPKG